MSIAIGLKALGIGGVGGTLSLPPTYDTYVDEAIPANTYMGVTPLLIKGGAGTRNNGLMRFDLSSIPSGARVISAALHVHNSLAEIFPNVINLHRVKVENQAWVGGCSWNYMFMGTLNRWEGDAGLDGGPDAGCSVADTDYFSTVVGQIVFPGGVAANTELVATLDVSEVQQMIGPEPPWKNQGFLLLNPGATRLYLHSVESATPDYRPELVLTYR